MIRSIGFPALLAAWGLLATPAVPAHADDKSTSAPARPEAKDKAADVAPPTQGSERAKFYSVLGEEPPQAFVPLKPRTVEERRHLDAVLDYGVARALEDRRKWAEAIGLLEQALKLEPESVTVLRRLSALCFSLGRTELGVKYSKQVLEAEPGDTATITRLVGYYRNRSDAAGAEAVLKDVLANPKLDKHAPGRLVGEYELGKLYAGRLKQPGKAADCFARVLEALDDKAATRLSPADQNRVLGGDEAAAYQEFGEVFDEAKRFELAVKSYRRGLVYEPDHPVLPLLLAEALLKLNKGDEALARVEAFLKRQPQGVEGYELLSKVLKSLHREGEITRRLEAAAAVDSKNVALQYVLADRYRETGDVERAERMYKSLLTAQPSLQGYGALAASLVRRKKAEELVKVLEMEAKVRPGGMEAVLEQLKAIINDPEMTDKLLDAGVKLFSAEPPQIDREGISVLAYVATRADKLEKFLPLQRLVLKRAPSAQAYKELIDVLGGLKMYGEATSTLEEMLKAYPAERTPRRLAELSSQYRLADQPEKAVAAAREALKLDPNDQDALVQLAVVLSQTGKVDESIATLKPAVAHDPANPRLAVILGSILSQAGRHDEALAVFKGLLEKFPNNDEVVKLARSNLSIVYVNMGDFAKGEAELEGLLEHDPDDPGVNNDLGYLYADQGKNLEKAEVMIRKAVQEDGENNAYLDSLGWVLFKRGKAKEALDPLEKAAKNSSPNTATDATIFEHLGDVYFELRETAKAKAAWTSAETAASKAVPPDKRLPEIRKKLGSLKALDKAPKESSGATP